MLSVETSVALLDPCEGSDQHGEQSGEVQPHGTLYCESITDGSGCCFVFCCGTINLILRAICTVRDLLLLRGCFVFFES